MSGLHVIRARRGCVSGKDFIMKLKYLNLVLVFSSVALFSPAAFANDGCAAGEPASEAACLLTTMKDQALQVRTLSDSLQGLDHQGFNNFWQYDIPILSRAKKDVNNMDQTLYRLRSIQSMCTPVERRDISLLAPSVLELSDSTQATIAYFDQHKLALVLPAYRDDARVMYAKANRVVNLVDDYQDYVLERGRLRELRSDLRFQS